MSNDIEISDKTKNYLKQVLYKAQFKQKLGIKHKLASGVSVFLILALYVTPIEFMAKGWIYLGVMFLYSKWFFNYTKDKGYYEPFLIRIYANFKRKLLLALRENRSVV